MKSGLVGMMQDTDTSAVVVYEPNGTLTSRNMKWTVTPKCNLAHRTCALFLQDGERILLHGPMETQQAKRSGLTPVNSQSYDDSVAEVKDKFTRELKWLQNVFEEYGLTNSKVEFHTTMDSSLAFPLLHYLESSLELNFVDGYDHNSINRARETKGPEEIDIIMGNAMKSDAVFEEVANYLKNAKVSDDGQYLLNPVLDGETYITSKHMKKFIRMQLFTRDLLDTEPTFFSIGKDCADPHNQGTDADPVQFGKTILMDMFPQQIGGGYFFDCTRTWYMGEVPDAIQRAYDVVKLAQDDVIPRFRPDTLASKYHSMASKIISANGYEVTVNGVRPKQGFRHGLGHGFGLEIHEEPFVSDLSPKSVIRKGSVFTVEPGIYQPEDTYTDMDGNTYTGFGIRIEDVIAMDVDNGEPINLTKLPKVLRIR